MQHAKKLVIVDPRLLDQLQVDREYKHIQRPADALAKTSLSLDISRILQDDSVPEDVKARQYQDALRRYHNVRSTIPQEIKTEPNPLYPQRHAPLRPPSPPPQPQPPPPPIPPPVHIPGPRRRYRSPSPPVRRRSARERRPPRTAIPWVAY